MERNSETRRLRSQGLVVFGRWLRLCFKKCRFYYYLCMARPTAQETIGIEDIARAFIGVPTGRLSSFRVG